MLELEIRGEVPDEEKGVASRAKGMPLDSVKYSELGRTYIVERTKAGSQFRNSVTRDSVVESGGGICDVW